MAKKNRLSNPNGFVFVTTDNMRAMAEDTKAELARLTEDKNRRIKGVNFANTIIQEINFKRFPCGEVKPKVSDNVRKKDVFLFYDFNGLYPNDDIVNFLITLNALHLADARRIIPVVPYMPYLRQDRKDEPRVPISAAWFIQAIEMCPSVKRLITVDMHSEQLQAVFRIATDHLPGRVILREWAKSRFHNSYNDLVIVAPDEGSFKRCLKLANDINSQVGIAMFNKKRDGAEVEMLSLIGEDVTGKICLINDDMMDTCGTIIKAAKALHDNGAREVILSATHPIFSESNGSTAYGKLAKANVQVVVTDSLQTESADWLEVLPLGPYLGQVIYQHLTPNGSVSKLIRRGLEQ